MNKNKLLTQKFTGLKDEADILIDSLKTTPEFKRLMKNGSLEGLNAFIRVNKDKFYKEIVPKIQKCESFSLQLRNGVIDLIGTTNNQSESLIRVDIKQYCSNLKA